MNDNAQNAGDIAFNKRVMTSFIQIAALAILITFCVITIGPFSGLVIWGVILAVAIHPLHLKLASLLGGRAKTSVVLIVIVGIVIIALPGWAMTKSIIASIAGFAADVKAGTVAIRPPPDKVAEWPIVGAQLHATWSAAADNFSEFAHDFQPQLRDMSEWAARKIGGIALGMLQMLASMVIAGAAMLFADNGYGFSCSVAKRISPARGQHWIDLSIATIRSVTNGVLGVAAIQAVLAGIGFWVMGVPHGGLLAAVVLVTAIIQVPALLIILPIIIWVFSFAAPIPATIFAVYGLAVALSDNVLKPLLLGRGVELPALLVLVGALGGMIQYGVVGLFIGAIILGLGYTIISDWVDNPDAAAVTPENG